MADFDIRADPFLGLVCYTCRKEGEAVSTAGRRSMVKAIATHMEEKHQGELAGVELRPTVDSLFLSVDFDFRRLGKQVSDSSDRRVAGAALMRGRFDLITATTCGSCQKSFKPGCRQSHVKGCSRSKPCITTKVFIHKSYSHPKTMIHEGADVFRVLHRYMKAKVVSNRMSVRSADDQEDDDLTIEEQRQAVLDETTEAGFAVAVPPGRVDRKFHHHVFHPSIVSAFSGRFSLGKTETKAAENFYHTIEKFLRQGSCQPVLAEFVCTLYGPVVKACFNGDWHRYAEMFWEMLHQRRASWEDILFASCKKIFGDLYCCISRMSPQFLQEISVVGDRRPMGSIHQVVKKAMDYSKANMQDSYSDEALATVKAHLTATVDGTYGLLEDDNDYNSWLDERSAKYLIQDIVGLVDLGHSAVTGIPKEFGPLGCQKTKDSYCSTMAEYVVFVARVYMNDFVGGAGMSTHIRKRICDEFAKKTEYDKETVSERRAAVVMELLTGSLHLEERHSFAGMVTSKWMTVSELFCLAKGLDKKSIADAEAIFHFKSPAAVHGAASRLFYSLRLAACGAYLHAADSDDLHLQLFLDNPKTMTCSSTWRSLARIQKIAKSFEEKIEEGLEPATVSRSREDCGLPDMFRIRNPALKTTVTVTRCMLCACSRTCHRDITRMTSHVLEFLQGETLDIRGEADGIFPLDLSDSDNFQSFTDAILLTLPEYDDIGEEKMSADRNFNNNEEATQKGNKQASKPGNRTVYWSTLSCTYYGTLPDGRRFSVTSTEVSRKIAGVLHRGNNLSRFLDAHAKIPVILAVMMLYMLRGSARETEILRLQSGITNLFFAKEMLADVSPGLRPGTSLKCDVRVRFHRRKHGSGGGQQQATLLTVPNVLAVALGNYLAVIRTAALYHVMRVDDFVINDCVQLATRLYVSLTVGKNGLWKVSGWGAFSDSVRSYLNSVLGFSKGTLTLQMLRQISCAIAQTLNDEEASRLRTSASERSRVSAFNHTVATHHRRYQAGVRIDATRLSVPEFTEGRRQDMQTAEYVGCPEVVSTREDWAADGPASWRLLRLMSDDVAFGCFKFGCSMSYEQRSPVQRHMVTEAVTASRDSLFVYPCGSGKTSLCYILPVYAFVCSLGPLWKARNFQHDVKLRDVFVRRRGMSEEVAGELVSQMKEDADIVSFWDYCSRDPHPPPPGIINVVLVPYVSVREGLISEINKSAFVRAVEFDAELLSSLELDGEGRIKGVGEFDVMVGTVASAVQDHSIDVLLECQRRGVIGSIVIDEVHAVLVDNEWMTDLNRIRDLHVASVPIVGMTGTLQKKLQLELAQSLLGNFGYEGSNSSQAVLRRYAGSLRCVAPIEGGEVNKAVGEWRRRQGIYRLGNVLPGNVAMARLDMKGTEKSMAAAAIQLTYHCRAAGLGGFRATSVLILCATRQQVDWCAGYGREHSSFCTGDIVTLKGSATKEEVDCFHLGFRGESAFIGITTSVGAQSLNNKDINLVVILGMCYGVQVVVQGLCRSGRAGQQSLCVYLHHQGLARKIMGKQIDSPYLHLEKQMRGVNLAAVDFALSPSSLQGFLYSKRGVCLRKALEEAMDDGSATGTAAPLSAGWCCSGCHDDLNGCLQRALSSYGESEFGLTRLSAMHQATVAKTAHVVTDKNCRPPSERLFMERETGGSRVNRQQQTIGPDEYQGVHESARQPRGGGFSEKEGSPVLFSLSHGKQCEKLTGNCKTMPPVHAIDPCGRDAGDLVAEILLDDWAVGEAAVVGGLSAEAGYREASSDNRLCGVTATPALLPALPTVAATIINPYKRSLPNTLQKKSTAQLTVEQGVNKRLRTESATLNSGHSHGGMRIYVSQTQSNHSAGNITVDSQCRTVAALGKG